MAHQKYTSPPITESVIEVRFPEPHDPSKLKKTIKKFGIAYADYTQLEKYKVNLGIQDKKPTTKPQLQIDHRLSSKDMTEQLTFRQSTFLISQLAPYQGWEHFIERFKRDFEIWKKNMGYQPITQIGVRYINRIDVPFTENIVEHEKFLNIYPLLPDILETTLSYAVQVVVQLHEIKSLCKINSAVVESPLPKHISLVIDQDIIRKDDPPQKEDAIYKLLNEIRVKKNEIFEACVTDRARELF